MKSRKYASHYEETRSVSARGVARGLALSTLGSFYNVTGQTRALLEQPRVHFIYLHHVFEDERDPFRELLGRLSHDHTFISHSEAVKRLLDGNIDKPYVTVSFDDGLKNCLDAAKIMNDFGSKGCFFIPLAMVGETDYHKIKAFCAEKINLPPTEFLSWDDLETLLKDGHEIGGHTVSHQDLAKLSPRQAEAEIVECFELLRERLGTVKHFSWPFGRFRHFGPAQAKMVFEAGFESCASAERGCHVVPQGQKSSLCLRRDHIIAKWPIEHSLYFMAKSSRTASEESNDWPEGWLELIP